MWCKLTRLRRKGLRLRPSELEDPIEGDLLIKPEGDGQTSLRRPILEAHLRRPHGVAGMLVDVVLPIFDVRMIGVDGQTLTISGVELSTGPAPELRVTEYVQIWRCAFVTPGDPTRSPPHP
jgi:hypothetical protein